jgi:hypothetical protein
MAESPLGASPYAVLKASLGLFSIGKKLVSYSFISDLAPFLIREFSTQCRKLRALFHYRDIHVAVQKPVTKPALANHTGSIFAPKFTLT